MALLVTASLVGALASVPTNAQEPPDTPPAPTTAALLAAACSGCHVKTATEDGFPALYGRPMADIRDALLAFKSGEREGTVMNRIAAGYSETEIQLLSNFLSAQRSIN